MRLYLFISKSYLMITFILEEILNLNVWWWEREEYMENNRLLSFFWGFFFQVLMPILSLYVSLEEVHPYPVFHKYVREYDYYLSGWLAEIFYNIWQRIRSGYTSELAVKSTYLFHAINTLTAPNTSASIPSRHYIASASVYCVTFASTRRTSRIPSCHH